MTRWITGIILAACVTALLLYAPQFLILTIVAVLCLIGLYEFFEMTFHGPLWTKICGYLLGMLLSVVVMMGWPFYPFMVLLLMLSFLLQFPSDTGMEEKFQRAKVFLFGILYCGLLFGHLGLLRTMDPWKTWVFLTLAATFASDTGAYITGRSFGRHKLAPRISPGKSIEGYWGGVVFAILAGIAIHYIFPSHVALLRIVLIAALVGIIAPLGDLSESVIKRASQAKDSGNLIPGHGGLLDRVDALLFAAPLVYYMAWFTEGLFS